MVKEKEEAPAKITRGASEDTVTGTPEKATEQHAWLAYQTKKVNGVLVIGGKETDPDGGSKADNMKTALLAQKTVSILIPVESGSDPKVPYSITLNGYRLDIPTNTYVEVPEQVAEVVRQSNKQTVAALNQFKAENKKELV